MAKTALVTGGTRGIGQSISLALRAAGISVAATFTSNEDKAKAFSEQHDIAVFRWNVAEYQECVDGVNQVREQLGEIDILVNNAGITRDTTLHKMSPEQWSQVIRTNLDSCYNMCSQVINQMRERNYGRIINISSVNGLAGQIGQTNYSAAKAGMIGFTKALALETARYGITVNAVAPGYINTEMVQAVPAPVLEKIVAGIPVKRLGEPEEIANLVAYLSSEQAGFVTGATYSINGGQYLQ